ncbi:hypothetical protein CSPX01_15773 [Colletotrichum filicis]|nr:hypothetical protein CSPX01_15773 [Colletotrichum filicis]
MSIAIRLWSLALALAALPCACPSPVSPPFYSSILITIILGALGVPFSCNIIHIRMHEYTRIGRLEANSRLAGRDQIKANGWRTGIEFWHWSDLPVQFQMSGSNARRLPIEHGFRDKVCREEQAQNFYLRSLSAGRVNKLRVDEIPDKPHVSLRPSGAGKANV